MRGLRCSHALLLRYGQLADANYVGGHYKVLLEVPDRGLLLLPKPQSSPYASTTQAMSFDARLWETESTQAV